MLYFKDVHVMLLYLTYHVIIFCLYSKMITWIRSLHLWLVSVFLNGLWKMIDLKLPGSSKTRSRSYNFTILDCHDLGHTQEMIQVTIVDNNCDVTDVSAISYGATKPLGFEWRSNYVNFQTFFRAKIRNFRKGILRRISWPLNSHVLIDFICYEPSTNLEQMQNLAMIIIFRSH